MAAAPAFAAPFHSDNVQLVTKLPDTAGAASARLLGQHLYVSTWKGLSIFDISKADDPQRVGFLPLPHFENEDVDAAGDIVVISNDPSEGVGVLTSSTSPTRPCRRSARSCRMASSPARTRWSTTRPTRVTSPTA